VFISPLPIAHPDYRSVRRITTGMHAGLTKRNVCAGDGAGCCVYWATMALNGRGVSTTNDQMRPEEPNNRSDHGPSDRGEPTTTETFAEVDKLHVMAHEMANLIDGSMRCLQLAWTALPDEAGRLTISQLDTARRQVDTVRVALERMTDVLRSAMGGTVGRRFGALDHTTTLGQALFHAIDVARGVASEHRVKLTISVASDVGETPAAMIYPAVLNGVYNAIESIASRGGGGEVEVTATRRDDEIIIEIADDGAGVDPMCTDGRAFEFGRTTKPDGEGLGLTICRSVLHDLGGQVQLVTRHPERVDGRGAVLRFRFPARVAPDRLEDWVGKYRNNDGESR